jgi:hypothetical protein
MNDREPARVSLPRTVWVAVGVVVALQLGTLGSQLVLQSRQLDAIETQRDIAERQLRETLLLARDTRPLAREQREELPRTQRTLERVDALAREATPLARELRDARAGDAAQAARALAVELLRADVPEASRAVRALSTSLLRADLPAAAASLQRTLPALAQVGDELLRRRRLRRLLVRTLRISGEVIEQDLVRRTARAADATVETTGVTRELLAIQREALAAIRETLVVVREAERHVESIDRRTGGTAEPAPVGSARP